MYFVGDYSTGLILERRCLRIDYLRIENTFASVLSQKIQDLSKTPTWEIKVKSLNIFTDLDHFIQLKRKARFQVIAYADTSPFCALPNAI